MAYEKLNLPDGTVLDAAHLEHIESGIANSGGIGNVGSSATATGSFAHAEGTGTEASGINSHAEGSSCKAVGSYSHAEGNQTKANGMCSHSEGFLTIAKKTASHAEGKDTVVNSYAGHVQGKYNVEDTAEKFAHIVGNGESDTARSNAHTLDWNGVPWYAGDRVMLGGTGMDDENAVALMPPLVVKIGEETPPGSGIYAVDKTAAEIHEAFTAGRFVFAVDAWNQSYYLEGCDGVNAIFSRAIGGNTVAGTLFGYLMIAIDADGTATMEDVFGYCLPVPTAEDNGKTLKVVDGKWALV